MEVETIVRRWGDNSLAVVIPKDVTKEANLKEGDKLRILIEKKVDLSDVFGTLKTKTTGQKFKQMCKENSE